MTGSLPEPDALLSHADFVRRLSGSLIRDPNAADDLAQGTLVRALEHPPASSTNLRGWLAAVTRNFARQGKRGDDRRAGRERRAARPEARA